MIRCLGILRETQHSPGRETDDAKILRRVLEELERSGMATRLLRPEELDAADLNAWDLVLPMCESYPRLKRLEAARADAAVVNAPEAVLGCYRSRMVPLLSRRLGLTFPPSEIRPVGAGPGTPPTSFNAPEGWWIKRGDVHNTCDRDVVQIRSWSELAPILKDFRSREITHFLIQPHLPGDQVKFYGVGPGRWDAWFHHAPSQARGWPFDPARLAAAAAVAASAIGLEIFGGDAVVSADGTITLIDINSWPSFARVRDEAAVQIARHLRDRMASYPLTPSLSRLREREARP